MTLFDLRGRVAAVTGGNAGIGFGIAQGLAGAGAAIVIAGRRSDRNHDAVSALVAHNAKAAAFELDVRNESSCRSMIERTVEQFGRVDILINNAGMAIRKQPQDYSAAEW